MVRDKEATKYLNLGLVQLNHYLFDSLSYVVLYEKWLSFDFSMTEDDFDSL